MLIPSPPTTIWNIFHEKRGVLCDASHGKEESIALSSIGEFSMEAA